MSVITVIRWLCSIGILIYHLYAPVLAYTMYTSNPMEVMERISTYWPISSLQTILPVCSTWVSLLMTSFYRKEEFPVLTAVGTTLLEPPFWNAVLIGDVILLLGSCQQTAG